MVVEEDDEYITNKILEEKIVKRKDEQQDFSVARSYAPVPRNSMNYAQSYNIFSTTTRTPQRTTTPQIQYFMSSDIEYDYYYDYDKSSIHQSLDWNSYDYNSLAEVHV